MSKIRLTVAQFGAGLDIDENRRISTELIAAAGDSSDLVVLPENAMYSDPGKERPDSKHSEDLDGPYVTAVKEAAKAAEGTAVIAGFTEINPDHAVRPFNTLVYISAEGVLADVYRKIHLYDAFGYRESDTVTAAPISKPLVLELGRCEDRCGHVLRRALPRDDALACRCWRRSHCAARSLGRGPDEGAALGDARACSRN